MTTTLDQEAGVSVDPTRVCEHILRHDGITPIRCAALARQGSFYCPVHAWDDSTFDRPKAPTSAPAPARDPDADVLPWQPDDVAIFDKARRPRRGRRDER